eukprot:CAMPEP_0117540172 /NCGR_PEP_ID=MMETSP0784-20121206/43363_1 /TAXON_ID=39447 /ORGANISM="" /LENGTH=399 /DNA_ID=CAMNT_0005336821 /DNA_START=17 /DNA_END=1216 /DNA_ORIENTATION=+
MSRLKRALAVTQMGRMGQGGLLALLSVFAADAFLGPRTGTTRCQPVRRAARVASRDGADAQTAVLVRERVPIYSFQGDAASRAEALAKFERIDDVVMGGVSKSQLLDGNGTASWRGLVRTEGGGFCGQRTRPFREPFDLTGASGLYVMCRLASDMDAERRVWKLSMRTADDRGEVVYQAPFSPPSGGDPMPVYVPFSDFVLVRGPVAVPGGAPLDNVSAVYQLGFTVSKFVIGATMVQLEDFRNGTFQLDIAELGAYSEGGGGQAWLSASADRPTAPEALPEGEARRQQPLLLRLLVFPLLGLVFSETKRRRRRAAQLFRERGASTWDLARMGWQLRRGLRGQGFLPSVVQAMGEAMSAVVGAGLTLVARLTFLPILRVLGRRRMRRKLGAEAEKATRL